MNILITGATSGIGQQLVTDYAAAGHHVWACGRNQHQLDIMTSNNVITLCFDVSNAAQCRQLLTGLPALDLVILSAGVCEYIDDAQHFDLELVQRVFAVNFFGMLNCAQPLLPQLQPGSKLVFIDSMSRLLPFSRAQAYGASKAAIHYFASSLATDLQPRGIDIVTVSPGFVKTPMTDANDFAMPTRISVAEASHAIQKQLAISKQSIYFPRLFSWLLRLLHLLPAGIQRRIAQQLKNDTE